VRPFQFALIFFALLLFGFGILATPPAQTADAVFSRWLVHVSQTLIHLFGGHAVRQGAILRAPGGFGVEMRDGCNAVNVTIFLWSAVLAFPASWKMKGLGVAIGSSIIQAVNILRFITLFYLGQYSMAWFDFAHNYLWESLLVLDTMVVFWLWVNRVAGQRYADAAV
jgi:exosortase H (IPTLxxWG-CTERM-specific)